MSNIAEAKEEPMITITLSEYNDLIADCEFLQALRNAGVDSWDGYSDAYATLEEYNEDE